MYLLSIVLKRQPHLYLTNDPIRGDEGLDLAGAPRFVNTLRRSPVLALVNVGMYSDSYHSRPALPWQVPQRLS
jgi:hypothetical protein